MSHTATEQIGESVRRFKRYPVHKDSGVEWLGLIPEKWEAIRLGRVFSLQAGYAFRSEEFCSEGISIVRMSNLKSGALDLSSAARVPSHSCQREFSLQAGDLLVGMSGSISNYAVVKESDLPCQLNQRVGRFQIYNQDRGHYRFLLNLVQSEVFQQQMRFLADGTAQVNISSSEIEKFWIPLLPLIEQRQIAAFLDRETAKINALVAKKERLIELLQEKRTALISHAVTKGLDPNVPMKDSGVEWLGPIPAHWGMSKLLFVTHRIGDGLHGTPEYLDGSGFYFVNGNNLVAESIRVFDNTREVTPEAYQDNMLPLCERTVLLSINGTIGNLSLYRDERIMLGKSAAFINCGPKLDRLFLTKYLQSDSVRRYFDLELTGTTISNLSLASIRQMPIVLPPVSEQSEIYHVIEKQTAKVDSLIAKVRDAIDTLREYRTAMISAAVTGKIDVREEVS